MALNAQKKFGLPGSPQDGCAGFGNLVLPARARKFLDNRQQRRNTAGDGHGPRVAT